MSSPAPELTPQALESPSVTSAESTRIERLRGTPLHRRYRFWMPLMAVFPALLVLLSIPRTALDSYVLLVPVLYNNLILQSSRLWDFLYPSWASLIIFSAAAMFGFWYLIGFALDWLRARGGERSGIPGWTWLLALLSMVELIRLSFHYSVFSSWYIRTVLSPRYNFWARYGQEFSNFSRLNLLLLAWIAPIFWALVWFIVLRQTGTYIRRQRSAASDVSLRPEAARPRKSIWLRLRWLLGIAAAEWLLAYNYVSGDFYVLRRRPTSDVVAVIAVVLLAFLGSRWLLPELRPQRLMVLLRQRIHLRQVRAHAIFVFTALAIWLVLSLAGKPVRQRVLAAFGQGHNPPLFIFLFYHVAPFVLPLVFFAFYRDWLLPGIDLPRPRWAPLRRLIGSRTRTFWACATLAAWLLVTVARQNLSTFWSILGYGSIIVMLVSLVPRSSRYRWIVYGAVPPAALLFYVGSYSPERDLVLFGAAFAIAYCCWMFVQRLGWHPHQLTAAAFLFVCIWGLCSAGDLLPNDLTYFEEARLWWHDAPERFALLNSSSARHVGVALSGGGYRAALMHAGVLDALDQLKVPVTNIAAVSGGSIVAAEYALGGNPHELEYDLLLHQFNTKRDFADLQNATRMLAGVRIPLLQVPLLPEVSFARTDVQARAWDRALFHGKSFNDLSSTGPKLMICTTDLNTGNAVGLTANWRITRFLLRPPGEELFSNVQQIHALGQTTSDDSTFALLDSTRTPLSKAVAASSAFPLAFDPVLLATGRNGFFLLADGGVTDNTGLSLLLEADRRARLPADANGNPQGDKQWALDEVISVDAGAMYQRNSDSRELGSLEAFGRAIDIISDRIRPEAAPAPNTGSRSPAKILLSPSLFIDNSSSFDFTHIGKAVPPLADDPVKKFARDYWGGADGKTDPISAMPPNAFAPEQQQLFQLVSRQLANLDEATLQQMLAQFWGDPSHAEWSYRSGYLEGVNPGYYGDLPQRLAATHLKPEQLQLLYEHALGRTVDPAALATINRKRLARIEVLRELSLRVAQDLSFCLAAFVRTPTLQDDIPERTAMRLYRLGQYLALLMWPSIRASGPTADGTFQFGEFTPGEKASVTCAIRTFTHFGGLHPDLNFKGDRTQLRKDAQQDFDSCLHAQTATNPALARDLAGMHVTLP